MHALAQGAVNRQTFAAAICRVHKFTFFHNSTIIKWFAYDIIHMINSFTSELLQEMAALDCLAVIDLFLITFVYFCDILF